MRLTLHRPLRRVGLSWPALALLALCSLGAAATELGAEQSGTTADAPAITTPAAAQTDKPKQCYNGCQRWGQSCNVDPRGVYKCQRRCEKFGEICE
jgi:hypothetical protein